MTKTCYRCSNRSPTPSAKEESPGKETQSETAKVMKRLKEETVGRKKAKN